MIQPGSDRRVARWRQGVVIGIFALALTVPLQCVWMICWRIPAQMRAEVSTLQIADVIIPAVYRYRQEHARWPADLRVLVIDGFLKQEQLADWVLLGEDSGRGTDTAALYRSGAYHITLLYVFDVSDALPPYQNWDIRCEGDPLDWRRMSGEKQ